ncbi:MAG: esterase-like activity of phytase family protein [Proteobacteria bacterium]|nr:esterase-like activity of phytase family protein [Pseudomonadota bacterium]
MKVFAGTIAFTLVFVILSGTGRSEPLSVRANAVNLHDENDQIRRVGSLIFRGGLHLTSPEPRFGGLSGLAISADGSQLSAVTDRGDWVRFAPVATRSGQLTGLDRAQIGRLLNLDGKPLRGKRDSDAESLSVIDGGFAVAFERRHRLWLYRGTPNPFLSRPTDMILPALSQAMPPNAGVEVLARLRDGRVIAISEDFPRDASYAQGWIFEERRWRGFRYSRHALFLPAGATTLPGGDLLVLERRFSYIGGFGTRLVVLSPKSIRPGAEVTGQEVARFEEPLITENFEGIASYRNGAGETVLYLISDDNFNALQRTILLKFTLER